MSKGVWGSIAALLAVAAIVAAGCGGGESEETLTKAEFTKQANAICKKTAEQRGKVIAELAQQMDPKGNVEKQQEKLVQEALPTYESATQQIDELGAPEGDEEKVEDIVEAMEGAVAKAEADPKAALVNSAAFEDANDLLKSYGLKECLA